MTDNQLVLSAAPFGGAPRSLNDNVAQWLAVVPSFVATGGQEGWTVLTGPTTMFHLVSLATNNAQVVKNAPGVVVSAQCFNVNASPRYLKFYNKATTPAPASDTPVKVLMMPGNTTGAGVAVSFTLGAAFSTGIAIAIVTGISDTDNTAVGSADCVVNFDYL